MKVKRSILLGGIAGFVVLGALGGWYMYSQGVFDKQSDDTTDNETSLTLSEILEATAKKNNLKGVLSSGMQKESSSGWAEGEQMMEYTDEYFEYNYSYSKSSTKVGPANDKCLAMFYPGGGDSNEYYYFKSDDGTVSKSITKDIDGNLTDYYYSESSENSYTDFQYRGGKYALQSVYTWDDTIEYPGPVEEDYGYYSEEGENPDDVYGDVGDEEPIGYEDPMTIDGYVSMFFGEDAELIGEEEINGESYYVIKSSFMTDCNMSMSWSRPEEDVVQDMIVSVAYVNTEDFNIYKVADYFHSYTQENLMHENIYETENNNVTWAEVESIMKNDWEGKIPVKDVGEGYYNPTLDDIMDYLENKEYSVVLPEGAVSYYLFDVIYQEWSQTEDGYCNRDFFPEGTVGDELYGTQCILPTDDFPVGFINAEYEVGTDYITGDKSDGRTSVYMFIGTDIQSLVYDSYIGEDYADDSSGQVTTKEVNQNVKINGQNVATTLYTTTYTYSYDKEFETYVSKNYIFELDGNTYLYHITLLSDDIDDSLLSLKKYKTTSVSDMKALREVLSEADEYVEEIDE